MKILQTHIKNMDSDKIVAWLTDISIPEVLKPKQQNRILHALLKTCDSKSNNLDAIESVFDFYGIDVTTIDSLELGIFGIKYFLLQYKFDSALILYQKLLKNNETRRRHLELLLTFIHENLDIGFSWDLAVTLYLNYLLPNYEVTEKNVQMFLDAPTEARYKVLATCVGKSLVLKPPANSNSIEIFSPVDGITPDEYILQQMPIFSSENEKAILLKEIGSAVIIKNKRSKFQPPKRIDYDYVIDGANILFYRERRITPLSFERVDRVIIELINQHQIDYFFDPKILLVLHRRHFNMDGNDKKNWRYNEKKNVDKIINRWNTDQCITICKTPYGVDDDYFSLYHAIRSDNAILVSNDKIRNHVFKFSQSLSQWREERTLEYDISRNDLKLIYPPSYSYRIQESDVAYYIPSDDAWLRIGKTD